MRWKCWNCLSIVSMKRSESLGLWYCEKRFIVQDHRSYQRPIFLRKAEGMFLH